MGQVFQMETKKPPTPEPALEKEVTLCLVAHRERTFLTDGGWLEEPRFPIDSGNPQFTPVPAQGI